MFNYSTAVNFPSSDLSVQVYITIYMDTWHTLTEEKQAMLDHLLPAQVKKEPTEVEADPIFTGKDNYMSNTFVLLLNLP